MNLSTKIIEKLKGIKKPALAIYPIIIIITIPSLLIINTIWNLKSFGRDANFIVRHQAVSIAEVLAPIIKEKISSPEDLKRLLEEVNASNEDIIKASLLKEKEGDFTIYVSTKEGGLQETEMAALNQLAKGFNQPIAGLTYDPNLRKDVWNVVTPIVNDESGNYFLKVVLDTKSVSEILSRTTKDSIVILVILVVVTIILIANHFVFYLRSLRTKQLEELDRLKDEFISIAAHELRAPMTALIGYLELLRGKLAPSEVEKIKPDLEILNSLIGDLDSLINELLDVSRIEQGRFQVNLVDVKVEEVIQKVVNIMLPQAKQKGLDIIFAEVNLPSIKSDPERLRQVFTNIISNSIKYTLEGRVDVRAEVEEKFVKITVKDTGIGIPGEELTKLFSKFHRVKDKKTIDVRGTGLGLWITKQIIEILGGRINVESIYGTGTSVIITLPVGRVL
ncbi:hypothetical protein A2865_02380 [Candidatus Woesebacteria bacterium RIFCSPHIGHO2_01_FULL_39_17]|uniref:histidine kinase n=3 Tax=Candidatus Woeseibacteriota TaxID=1752722 RepID=A0A0G0NMF1_9BACT|nr:MAG: two-component sensor histidine kinase [Microgenomates group bacterium GW2011_GWC1_38_12]KKQ93927.1 MAG: PAS/PAC sensor hybrid histidine kinase [Candidatus Woesebacteria bacterium GW2011_GWB1_39_10b]KKR13996.1 MAG: PAS/PAC sensor hybrid histidine kinase [Candidatus Woesebacteria bacterium GW2011_GWA1_39_21b]OGM23490.1 MAG: hypothetical protein A2865_02380 [Candidatus Woesebacteria bacterium RIFCSPHIGHO2_01_FULL_39_17]OGM64279.1 MAG: hypothetical protein A3A52_03205 [Candidatus Woesebacte